MPESVELADSVGRRYEVLRPHLDERQRRLLLGAEAGVLGRGGIKAVAVATDRTTAAEATLATRTPSSTCTCTSTASASPT